MSDTFDRLKAMLDDKGALTDEEVARMVVEHGEMSAEENMDLSAAIHKKRRASQAAVTMDQFLEANKILDTPTNIAKNTGHHRRSSMHS